MTFKCAARSRRNGSGEVRDSKPSCAADTHRTLRGTRCRPFTRTYAPCSIAPTSTRCASLVKSSRPLRWSVPPAAWSKAPGSTFPSRSAPNSAAAGSEPRLAAMTMKNGLSARALNECRYRAYASRPDPSSPTSSAGELLGATWWICSRSAWVTLPLPMGTARDAPWARAERRLRRPASSARSTVRSSLVSERGFSTKSNAPSRVASTAVSTVPCPDIITTGQSYPSVTDHSRSSVMPSVSGIQMSSRTRSGTWAAREVRASAASAATSTS